MCNKHERRGALLQIRDQLAEHNSDVFTRPSVDPLLHVVLSVAVSSLCACSFMQTPLPEEADGPNMNSILPPKI